MATSEAISRKITRAMEFTLPPPRPHPPLPPPPRSRSTILASSCSSIKIWSTATISASLVSVKLQGKRRNSVKNSSFRSVNRDLNKQLSALIQASVQNHFSSSDYDTSPFELANALQGLCLGGNTVGGDISDESPTSVMEGAGDVERVMLPKSISVSNKPTKTQQKVYVQGGKEEEEPLELEVYNQGMFKTELCNKWQETGACPYGDHCQFAHGIKELRPVIRHPRYKTEVCRMVLAGDACPYGHRCHFRHALTEQESSWTTSRPGPGKSWEIII
ncbi:Zinc finger CCCH domain-containing protein 15 [Hibiscus syriacus]|uniref:Zinc finger CCCH domain-containing protein 15 n=1 Tax=Hibiscus syriacus TaxID=106335 RepID=A0A6A3BHN7_HIBSY|nr:Zinc finger CCCH domain-containing protein 15 [Hibiscus syriacus]